MLLSVVYYEYTPHSTLTQPPKQVPLCCSSITVIPEPLNIPEYYLEVWQYLGHYRLLSGYGIILISITLACSAHVSRGPQQPRPSHRPRHLQETWLEVQVARVCCGPRLPVSPVTGTRSSMSVTFLAAFGSVQQNVSDIPGSVWFCATKKSDKK